MTRIECSSLPEPREQPTISVAEAGRFLGLSKVSAYEAAHRGELPVIRIGRRLLVPTAALRRLLAIDDAGTPPSAA